MEPDSAAYFKCGIFLWRNVIKRAIQEAEGEVITVELSWQERMESPARQSALRRHYAARIQRSAHTWLTKDSFGLRVAFHFAQLPGKYADFRRVMIDRLGEVSRSGIN